MSARNVSSQESLRSWPGLFPKASSRHFHHSGNLFDRESLEATQKNLASHPVSPVQSHSIVDMRIRKGLAMTLNIPASVPICQLFGFDPIARVRVFGKCGMFSLASLAPGRATFSNSS